MPDLTAEEVGILAVAAGLPMTVPGDLEEVTDRLNALVEALNALDALPIKGVQPVPSLPHPDQVP